jgi:predicted RNA-binding Zn-ribbon protein involved in translation (DUF1610 family)
MSSDSIDIKNNKIAKFCPNCGANDVVVWDELLKCRKCYQFSAAFELDE